MCSSDLEETRLLADLVRTIEQSVETAARHRIAGVEADRDAIAARERLTQQHVGNLEALLAAAREHAAGLEKARDLTQAYADNMGRELEKHKLRREQADVLLRTARQQVTAYENALIGADAEVDALKASLAHITKALEESRTHSDNLTEQIRHLNAVHATELAAREAHAAAQDRKSTRLNSSHVKRSRMPSSA